MKNSFKYLFFFLTSFVYSNKIDSLEQNYTIQGYIGNYEIVSVGVGTRIIYNFYVDTYFGLTRANENVGKFLYFYDDFLKVGIRYHFSEIIFSPSLSIDIGRLYLRGEPTGKDGFSSINNKSIIGSGLIWLNNDLVKGPINLSFIIKFGIRYSEILDQGKKITPALNIGLLFGIN